MRKIYTILTSFIVIVLFVHTVYMILSVFHIISPNEDFAQNLGYTLMYSSIIHGLYGLLKWVYTIVVQQKLNKIRNTKKKAKMLPEARATLIQRLLGIVIIAIVIPHGYIKVLSAGIIPLVADICYVIALFIHVSIGFPKWIVSLGLRPALPMKNPALEGEKKKWK